MWLSQYNSQQTAGLKKKFRLLKRPSKSKKSMVHRNCFHASNRRSVLLKIYFYLNLAFSFCNSLSNVIAVVGRVIL